MSTFDNPARPFDTQLAGDRIRGIHYGQPVLDGIPSLAPETEALCADRVVCDLRGGVERGTDVVHRWQQVADTSGENDL